MLNLSITRVNIFLSHVLTSSTNQKAALTIKNIAKLMKHFPCPHLHSWWNECKVRDE